MKVILIADDNDGIRTSLVSGLRAYKVKIHVAHNVVTAKSVIDHHDLDLVVTDGDMPDGSGLDVLKHLREKNPTCPAVLFSGSAMLMGPLFIQLGGAQIFDKLNPRELFAFLDGFLSA